MYCRHDIKKQFSYGTSNNGYTLIELMLVVALLALFSIATLSLVVSSGSTYKNIIEEKDIDSGLRIALSYVDTKVKQNDMKGVLRLENNPVGDGKALVIQEETDGSICETWIYLSGGKLREALVDSGDPVQDDMSFEIADIEGFHAEYDQERKLLHVNVWNTNKNNDRRELETDITVKAGLTDKAS